MRMIATRSFAYGSKHGDMMMHGGTIIDSDSQLVKDFPAFFEPIDPPERPAPPPRRRRNG